MPAEVVGTFLHGDAAWYARCDECPANRGSGPWTSHFYHNDDAVTVAEVHNELYHNHVKSAGKR